MAEINAILTELVEDARYTKSVGGYTHLNDRKAPFSTLITNATKQIEEFEQNIGSELMASQIRKSIETGEGRFSNKDANWILDQCQQQRERVGNVVKYIEMAKHVLLRVGQTFDIVDIGDSLDAALKELEITNE